MTRRKKWILASLLGAIVLIAGVAVLAYLLLLPHLIRREVSSAFERLGLGHVHFDLTKATLWATDLRDVSSNGGEAVKIGTVTVRYSPLDALAGKLQTVIVTDGRLVIELDKLKFDERQPTTRATRTSESFDLPLERLELRACTLALKRDDREIEVPVNGSLSRTPQGTAQLTLQSTLATAELEIDGTIDPRNGSGTISARGKSLDVAVLAELLPRETYSLIDAASGTVDVDLAVQRDAGEDRAKLAIAVNDVSIVSDPDLAIDVHGLSGAVALDDALVPSTPPGQKLTASRLVVSGEELKNVAIAFHLAGPNELRVEQLSFAWAGGSVRAEPFTIDPSDPQVAVNVAVEHVGLRELVALVTRKHATGEGTVSGSVAVQVYKAKLDTGEEAYQVALGDGGLRADEAGNLRMGDAASDFGELMEQSDPRFRDDPLFREIKQDVLEAVRDFNFHVLEVRFRRDESGEQRTEIRLHGRGRTGNRLPANLNLNVTGAEDVVNGYLAAQSRVLSSVKRKGR